MRCIIYSPHWLRTVLLFVVKSAFYIFTLAWGLSALLVSTGRAMRRPLHCGTSDRTGSTFCMYRGENIKMTEQLESLFFENRELCDLKNGSFQIWTILKERL